MKKANTILIVDDDQAHLTMLTTLIEGWGYDTFSAGDGETAISKVKDDGPFDLVLMDIRMMRVSGLEALSEIRDHNPALPIILMTAFSSVETAKEALKRGAYDYLTKPLDFDELRFSIERALDHKTLKEENASLRERIGERFDRRNIIGKSPAMEKVLETVAQAAPSHANLLIIGPSGSGKELIAGAVHYNSLVKDGPFIKMNCAAVTETLLESELFGHEKGAFTGAHRRKEGKFKQADGGSLFLDEVSEMSLSMQAKILRVLQEKEFVRVGGEEVLTVEVRVISATNKDLRKEIEEGRFREDLYYRLNVVAIHVPPLRDRKEDIPLLAMHFLKKFADENRKAVKGFTPKALDRMIRYEWPGNVRELMNMVERVVVLAQSEHIDLEDIPPSVKDKVIGEEEKPVSEMSGVGERYGTKGLGIIDQMEKDLILKTLQEASGNKSEAARRLGITRKTLRKKLDKYKDEI